MATTKPEPKKNKRETKAEDKTKVKKADKPKSAPKGKYPLPLLPPRPSLSDDQGSLMNSNFLPLLTERSLIYL